MDIYRVVEQYDHSFIMEYRNIESEYYDHLFTCGWRNTKYTARAAMVAKLNEDYSSRVNLIWNA